MAHALALPARIPGDLYKPKHLQAPTPPKQAIDQVEIWMESPTLRLLHESHGYWPELSDAFLRGKLTGAQAHDARIHAICRAHAVTELWSADRDFFPPPRPHHRQPLPGIATDSRFRRRHQNRIHPRPNPVNLTPVSYTHLPLPTNREV